MHIEQLEIAALTNCPHAANDTRAIRHHQKVVWPASQRPELFWRLVEEPAFERGCVVLVVRKAHLGDGTTEHFHRCFRVGIQSRSNINARMKGVSPAYYRFLHGLPTVPSTESEELPRSIPSRSTPSSSLCSASVLQPEAPCRHALS